MRIQVKGRNISVSDELREQVEKRFLKISRQLPELARLDVELWEERNPRIADSQVAEVTLHLKGTSPLRARDASPQMAHSINLVYEELARQVKRHRAKQRHRRELRLSSPRSASATL
jgi:putative sigma-54 modulation protein